MIMGKMWHPTSLSGCRALLLGTVSGLLVATHSYAQTVTSQDLESLRAAIQKQELELKVQSQKLNQQLQLLDAQQKEIQQLKAKLPAGPVNNRQAQKLHASVEPASPPPPPSPPSASSETQAQAASIQEPSSEEVQREKNQTVLQTTQSLASTGGVLTPKGVLVFEPTLQYDYIAQNQAVVNGFTIVPGITFGNVSINKVSQDEYTAGIRLRLGITDRLEINTYIPYIYTNSTTTTAPQTQGAAPLNIDATGHDIGDVQFGASYQVNSGAAGWPVFVANLQVKTITGTDPFQVPIYTTKDTNGAFLEGVQKRLPTGTGFYTLTPSITALYPTDPGILFANLKFIYNIPRTVGIQSPTGGAATSTRLAPGNGVGVMFGMGFSLNEKTAFSLGFEQDFYMSAEQNGQTIAGSSYRQGSFDFGLGYQLTNAQSINLGTAIGIGPNSPAAEIVLRYTHRFDIF